MAGNGTGGIREEMQRTQPVLVIGETPVPRAGSGRKNAYGLIGGREAWEREHDGTSRVGGWSAPRFGGLRECGATKEGGKKGTRKVRVKSIDLLGAGCHKERETEEGGRK